MSLAVLIPILAELGAPVLKKILEKEVGGTASDIGGTIIDGLASRLGVKPTPEAIVSKSVEDPKAVADAVAAVEQQTIDLLPFLIQANAGRDEMLAREDTKGFFHNGWRPAMSWLVIFLFGWALVALPVINAAFKANITAPSVDSIVQFAGIWLVIYGGGHTAKELWGRK